MEAEGACWLCVYATDEIAQEVNTLIAENAHCMGVETLAGQAELVISEGVRKKYGEAAAAALQGHTARHVARHVRGHMLHASVVLGNTLRGLVELGDQLRQQIHTVDEETGQRVIDATQVKNYLAVTNQVANLYKLGQSERLLFSGRESRQ